jgi:hypothetical protein
VSGRGGFGNEAILAKLESFVPKLEQAIASAGSCGKVDAEAGGSPLWRAGSLKQLLSTGVIHELLHITMKTSTKSNCEGAVQLLPRGALPCS